MGCIAQKSAPLRLRVSAWVIFQRMPVSAGHRVHCSNLNAEGAGPAYARLFPTRAARAADRKSSRSPPSTAWMLLVSTSVRRSFTIW